MRLLSRSFAASSVSSRGPHGGFDAASDEFYKGPYMEITQPDFPFIFAGDHTARVGAWQEGAALSAHRAAQIVADHVSAKKA